MKKIAWICLLMVIALISKAQDCTCMDSFLWLKETMEKNDAGFAYVLKQKGEAAYTAHNREFETKIKAVSSGHQPCTDLLRYWLQFFRQGHIWLAPKFFDEPSEKSKEEISRRSKNWPRHAYSEKEFNTYLSTLKTPGFEGIWEIEPYLVGVKKVKNEYLGFVIKAEGTPWVNSQIKFIIHEKNGNYTATYFNREFDSVSINSVKLNGNNFMDLDYFPFKRVAHLYPDSPIDVDTKLLNAEKPQFLKLSDQTLLLRIPTFDHTQKQVIDSVIQANKKLIHATPNLIIDIRYNGGGSDFSYNELLPIMYTNPIRSVGVEYWSTPANNKRMLDFLDYPEFTEEEKEWARKSYKTLSENLGKFVNLDTSVVSITSFDTVYAYPAQIAILVNEGNASTSEEFLLAAKQSTKVKLYGNTTFGALDISNMYEAVSPCGNYTLGYCLSRSMRIPDFTVDGKGIQPDIYLDKSVPKTDWITFVQKQLEAR
jgi:hypothetical protein